MDLHWRSSCAGATEVIKNKPFGHRLEHYELALSYEKEKKCLKRSQIDRIRNNFAS